jgi:hypothetical protein
MEYKAKSIIISRKPRGNNMLKTATISFFDDNDPHLKAKAPKEMLDFENTEKVEIKGMDVDYYTEGNDLVINDLESVSVEKKEDTVTVKKE